MTGGRSTAIERARLDRDGTSGTLVICRVMDAPRATTAVRLAAGSIRIWNVGATR